MRSGKQKTSAKVISIRALGFGVHKALGVRCAHCMGELDDPKSTGGQAHGNGRNRPQSVR
jgi:hypothetical protein